MTRDEAIRLIYDGQEYTDTRDSGDVLDEYVAEQVAAERARCAAIIEDAWERRCSISSDAYDELLAAITLTYDLPAIPKPDAP